MSKEKAAKEVREADGVSVPDSYSRNVLLPDLKQSGAEAAGAIKPGVYGENANVENPESGFANAARRAEHVMAKRRETEAIFEKHRKRAPGFPYAKNKKFVSE